MHFSVLNDGNHGKTAIFGGYEQAVAEMRGEPNSVLGKSSNGENEKQKERKVEKFLIP